MHISAKKMCELKATVSYICHIVLLHVLIVNILISNLKQMLKAAMIELTQGMNKI